MDLSSINSVAQTYSTNGSEKTSKSQATKDSSTSTYNETGVVYEKSSSETSTTDRAAIINQMKSDLEERSNQLLDIVRKTISQQGATLGKADDMWSFLASGNFTVDAATKAQAQDDISENGYWGVNQTSDRILDFAKTLSGGDPSKAQTFIDAFKKGYDEATKTWGKTLPDISQKTYDAVMDKFDSWVNGAQTGTETES